MPALTRLRIEALTQLADELRFSPKATIVAQIERAEALASALDPGRTYPEDWVIFQITRHRVERDAPALIVGEALIAEISAFVERISDDAALAPEHAPEGALRLPDLLQRWGVSARTIERWRRRGLVARRERLSDGKVQLVFSPIVVEGFETGWAARIERARRRTRISPEELKAIERRAAGLARDEPRPSRNAVAAAIARDTTRSREAIRSRLAAAADAAGAPLFSDRGALAPLEARRIQRGLRRGAAPAALARALGRSSAAIRRADRLARSAHLRRALARDLGALLVSLGERAGARGSSSPASSALLDAIATAQALEAPTPRSEATLGAFFARAADAPQPPDRQRESGLACAQIDLVQRAVSAVEGLSRLHPSERALDEIETALRLAWRLRCALVETQRRVVLAAIEERLQGSLLDVPPRSAARLHLIAMRAACSAAARFDARRGGRLAAPTAIVLARALAPATRALRAATGRARRTDIESTRLSDWTLRAASWAPSLAPPGALEAGLANLSPTLRSLVSQRFGLHDHQPSARVQRALLLGRPAHVLARLERKALADAVAGTVGREGGEIR